MNYWVIKSKPNENDLKNMLINDDEQIWSTDKNIPPEMLDGDKLFIWASSPIKKIIGIAQYHSCPSIKNTEKNTFIVEYKSSYIDTDLDIGTLRLDKILNKEAEPSFLKQGPAQTIFPLLYKQGERLSILFNENLEETLLSEDIALINDSNLTSTERETLVKSRVGQGKFRKDLINYWQGCSVTEVDNIDILVASHIKPWRDSTNEERLDPFNGFLLTPTLDKLFDKYYISFDDSGRIIISNTLTNVDKLGINKNMVIKLNNEHRHYLEHHRANLKKI